MCVKDEIGEVSEETEKLLSCDATVGKSSSFDNCPVSALCSCFLFLSLECLLHAALLVRP